MSKQARAEITYASGRTETIFGKVNKDGRPHALFDKKVSEYKSFPTVKDVKVSVS